MSAKGKISRLPFEIRKELNRRHREGEAPVDSMAWLNSLDEVKTVLAACNFGGDKKHGLLINAQNLSEWFRPGGPYEAWAKEELDVERSERRAEFAARLAKVTGGAVTQPAIAIAAGEILNKWEDSSAEDKTELTKALVALATAESGNIRAQTDKERLKTVQQPAVQIERQKSMLAIAKAALKLFEDAAARKIGEGGGSREEKIKKLLAYMEKQEREEQ